MNEQLDVFSFLGDKDASFDFPSTMDILLDYFRGYVYGMESNLERNRNQTCQQYEAADDPDEREYLSEHLFVQSNIFPELLRNSFIVSAYSILEKGLRDRCQCLQDLRAVPISVDDLGGMGIQKYKKYIQKLTAIDISEIKKKDQLWSQLLQYGEVRNRIVHHLGTMDKNNSGLVQFIEQNPHFDIRNGKILIDNGACQTLIELIASYFQGLDSQLPSDCSNLEPHFGFRP
ncbi:MAG TPA: hypothetical protein PLH19_12230 [Anaerolineae bacterium]|nr:hypothetical protein [Anaerolineae bacterium]HQH39285.1 hypothetical protein [Anaerolineae bacterium]